MRTIVFRCRHDFWVMHSSRIAGEGRIFFYSFVIFQNDTKSAWLGSLWPSAEWNVTRSFPAFRVSELRACTSLNGFGMKAAKTALQAAGYLHPAAYRESSEDSETQRRTCKVFAAGRLQRRQRKQREDSSLLNLESALIAEGGRAKDRMEGKRLAARAIEHRKTNVCPLQTFVFVSKARMQNCRWSRVGGKDWAA